MITTFMEFYRQWYAPEYLESLSKSIPKGIRLHSNDSQLPPSFVKNPVDWYPHAYYVNPEKKAQLDFTSPDYYVLDIASLAPVAELDPRPKEKIADLCAAPGGKSLAIAQRMDYQGTLWLNDLSLPRLRRLRANLSRYQVPVNKTGWELKVTHGSVRVLINEAKQLGGFDKILLDAPCSSEAHVLQDQTELNKWTPSRSRLLAKRQRKLLGEAIEMLKSGGELVYSTCSISPLENDDTIEFILHKHGKSVALQLLKLPLGTATKYGRILTPWQDQLGPMYWSKLVRV